MMAGPSFKEILLLAGQTYETTYLFIIQPFI